MAKKKVGLNAEPLTGGCQCGHIRYEISEEPVTFYICHCKECQKQSASAFGMSLTVYRAATKIVSGEMKVWSRDTDTGAKMSCYFCPECGVRLFHAKSASLDIWNLKAGTLDDGFDQSPIGHIWTRSAWPFVDIPQDSLTYETQPDDRGDLNDTWRRKRSS